MSKNRTSWILLSWFWYQLLLSTRKILENCIIKSTCLLVRKLFVVFMNVLKALPFKTRISLNIRSKISFQTSINAWLSMQSEKMMRSISLRRNQRWKKTKKKRKLFWIFCLKLWSYSFLLHYLEQELWWMNRVLIEIASCFNFFSLKK